MAHLLGRLHTQRWGLQANSLAHFLASWCVSRNTGRLGRAWCAQHIPGPRWVGGDCYPLRPTLALHISPLKQSTEVNMGDGYHFRNWHRAGLGHRPESTHPAPTACHVSFGDGQDYYFYFYYCYYSCIHSDSPYFYHPLAQQRTEA